ncbi:hypothetical protein OEZ86_000249 [Tetradesmus obliquus]|nr:hypothetical protein OEZ86_000249 [Tetradesmus obliquus]
MTEIYAKVFNDVKEAFGRAPGLAQARVHNGQEHHDFHSRSSPVQHPGGIEEDDSDYSPAGPHSSSGGSGKPQQWTDAEQASLEALVAQYGTRNWSSIASRMTGRTGKQCRERYINNTPELKKGNWTPQEDLLLAQLHSQLGNKP